MYAVLTTDVMQQVVLKAPAVSVYSNGSSSNADKFCVDVKYYTPLTSFVPSATITSTDQCGPQNSINTTIIRLASCLYSSCMMVRLYKLCFPEVVVLYCCAPQPAPYPERLGRAPSPQCAVRPNLRPERDLQLQGALMGSRLTTEPDSDLTHKLTNILFPPPSGRLPIQRIPPTLRPSVSCLQIEQTKQVQRLVVPI
jgi:hypothetical protein